MGRSLRCWLMLSTLAPAAAVATTPTEASACGGTFCDAGPQSMPVDQTGENILFVMNEGYTEAHIQIQYDPETDAEAFAWVVPLTVVPEFSVGSQPLFDAVLAGTVPRYGFTLAPDDCGQPAPPNAGDDGGDGGAGPIAFDLAGGGPEVVYQATVGAFEIAVLSGGTSDEVMTWLADNGYQQDPAAEPILASYLAEGMLFAAFKLTTEADVSEIHPIVLRFADSAEACIPLRLTRIAAADDMDVRAFFLADDRIVPQNYRHVLVNPLKIDWPGRGANYKEVITLAVDAEGADGHAFVTEFAGSSDAVNRFGIHDPAWNGAAFAELSPPAAVGELRAQGLLQCDFFCDYGHPLLEGLLTEYLPAPAGEDPREFYARPVDDYQRGDFDLSVWDSVAFAEILQDRIVGPGQHAVELLDAYPYLTRMYTTISPGEMTEDPLFHANPSLPDVDANRMATQRILCSGDSVWTLPDGREVFVPQGAPWPEFADEMPWEEEIAESPEIGAELVLVDRTEEIDALLAAYNAEQGWPGSGVGDGGGTAGGDGDGTGSSGGDDGGLDDSSATGCSCRTTEDGPAGLMSLLSLGLLGLRRRRRPTAFG